MQFNHPEVLYALLFLLIPILVHLFQLRKFRKEQFTNVKFLKRLSEQTRKSSKLKKWLVLTTRLFLLAAIILAFAQPFFPSKVNPGNNENLETIIYLDNSYSMQAQGQRGRLLDRTIQELLENLPEDGEVTLITNNNVYSPVSRNDLQNIDFSATQSSFKNILLQAENNFSRDRNSAKNLFLISDFQGNRISTGEVPAYIKINALRLQPERLENSSIDTTYITLEGAGKQVLTIELSHSGTRNMTVPVSLYSDDKLLGKTSADFSDENSVQVKFPLEDEEILNGTIRIEDEGLQFDNILYFSLNQPREINVVNIYDVEEEDFLNRIYTQPDFNYTAMPVTSVDYNILNAAQVIILNEIKDLSTSLFANLQQKISEDATFIVIPPEDMGETLNSLLSELNFPIVRGKQEVEKMITGISYNHPLFENVFEEETSNFEYPKVQTSYSLDDRSPVLALQDKSAFLAEKDENYLFTAPLNRKNSNFQLSPLVVPTFYNIAMSALRAPSLYFNLGSKKEFDVPVKLEDDRILQIIAKNYNFIPMQQSTSNKVTVTLEDQPLRPGNYKVVNEQDFVLGISFNIPRSESELDYQDLNGMENINLIENNANFFSSAGFNPEEQTLWKWFVTFALLMLFLETLLLKYLK